MSLATLPFDVEQRLLGVGVRIHRRPHEHLRHLPSLLEHTRALTLGANEPLEDVVQKRLAKLRERLWESPYYTEALKRAGLSPDELRSLEDLRHFPTLDRATLGARWSELPSLNVSRSPDAEMVVVISSGSTARAVPVMRSGYDTLHMWAVLRFWIERLHLKLPERPRVVLLCALPGGLEYSSRLPHFEQGALHRLSTLRPKPMERLHKAKPSVLFSDPAGLHWLLGQNDLPRPKLVLSSAQYLGPSQRSMIEQALQTKVVNYYATTELGAMAWECLEVGGHFHVLHPDVWAESMNGELVFTRLRDSVLPLLRYRPGDAGEVIEEHCSCGFRGRSIIGFMGRRACFFERPDGTQVDAWQLSWLFKDLPLVGFQLAQAAAERFQLQIDAELPMAASLLCERIERALVRLGWNHPEVSINLAKLHNQANKPEPFVRRL